MNRKMNLCGPHMTEQVIFSRQRTDFVNPAKGIRKTIVDASGAIRQFPGFENPRIVLNLMEGLQPSLPAVIYYRTEFRLQPDGTHLMIWQIQPDGRYWADEGGFGMENDDEIRVYSYLSDTGDFLAPFRIYNVGDRKYFGTHREEELAREQARKENSGFEKSLDAQLPAILDMVRQSLDRDGKTEEKRTFRIDGIPQMACIRFLPTARGGNLEFRLLRDEARYGEIPYFICTLEDGTPMELRNCLSSQRWLEKTRDRIWHYCCRFDDFNEELLREKQASKSYRKM